MENKKITVSSIMTRRVTTINMDATLETIQEVFDTCRFHHLLVVEFRTLVGVISDRDYLKAISPFIGKACERSLDSATLDIRAGQVMTRKPVTAKKDMCITEAVHLLLEKKISCLPIVSDYDGIEGIVTWKDIYKSYM